MARMSVDVNEEWLEAAQEVLGTPTKVATINEALRAFAVRKQAEAIVDAFDSVEVDVADSAQGWRTGGRDLARLAEDVRRDNVA
ncbi:type II toxin-antitoxin system VapB family antitoxin [Nocardia caishijiensis]|uniref:VapB protein of antitoxin of type II toxin-antitoxin system n=1 Tax=Nocardia caishijiensis TaxID=184756 RepID=A0ABQ6YP68_9NOCA|nr:type II toxin-antitoxin system VapB family antitoxin [Nocardia caishijiensis]KAF0847592.1 VapB protein of antitoxin of type II toxin-antitoxin system [Nocardia caishijiensis]